MQDFGTRGMAAVGLGLLVGIVGVSVQGCDADDLCGPCGTLATGQVSISGDAKLDGFFSAVADLGKATATIQGEFEANVRALGKLYGVADAAFSAEYVTAVETAIRADFDAHVGGGFRLVYKAPECKANINVAVEAQASCEASADCEVMADPGQVSVQCEGSCQGGCDAMCSGELSCAVKTPTVNCEGSCEGSCQIEGSASCDGTCHGDCDAGCSAENAAGECHGRCDGMCSGTCELAAKASCQGTCNGTCYVEQGSAQCTAEAECSGSCSGSCSGECKGSATPPSASADCEASAECNAQASAQAEANVECTPPSLDWEFEFEGGVSAEAQAAFIARLGELRVRGAAIILGLARASALITGSFEGEVIFEPAPVINLGAQIQLLIDAGIKGEFDVPAGKLTCVVPALEEAIAILGDASTEFTGSIAVQAQFVATISNPMGG
jgi:modification target Cys-rich repeat protein